MKEIEVKKPELYSGTGYSLYYQIYLYSTTWILRTLLLYISGHNEGHDAEIVIPTPGLGNGSITCNVWMPSASKPVKTEAKPMILVLEGGGFVLGSPKDGRRTSRRMADETGAIVISLDYAKAPRYPYPHALLQAYAVLKWSLCPTAKENGILVDPTRVAVIGNSAGGNLTAALSLLISFSNGPCSAFRASLPSNFRQVLQVMLYPSLELYSSYNLRFERTTPDAKEKSLPRWIACLMEASYLPPYIPEGQIFVAPVIAEVELLKKLNLAPAMMLSGSWDCLKEEEEIYARKLKEAGKIITYEEFPKAKHGFSNIMPGTTGYDLEIYEKCWEVVCSALKVAFA